MNQVSFEPANHAFHLSPRQTQIVKLVAGGLSDKEIAAQLGISPYTVQMHLRRLYRDRRVRNRAEAVAAWLKHAVRQTGT